MLVLAELPCFAQGQDGISALFLRCMSLLTALKVEARCCILYSLNRQPEISVGKRSDNAVLASAFLWRLLSR